MGDLLFHEEEERAWKEGIGREESIDMICVRNNEDLHFKCHIQQQSEPSFS